MKKKSTSLMRQVACVCLWMHACVRVCVITHLAMYVLWMFVDLLFSTTPRSKTATHSPPYVSLFLSLLLVLHLSTPSLIKICRPKLLIKSHLKSLKVSLRLIQFAFLNREHCLKGLINWTGKKSLLSAPCRQSLWDNIQKELSSPPLAHPPDKCLS